MVEYNFSVLGKDEHFVTFLYYKKLYESSQWGLAFPDGSVKSAADATALLLDARTLHTVITLEGRVLSIVRLDSFSGRSARVHFSFLPDIPRDRVSAMGEQYLDWVFGQDFAITTLLGVIHKNNFPAIGFAKSMGFQKLGIIEEGGYSPQRGYCDVVVLKKVKS